MSFQSLNQVLAAIENQPSWQKQRQYRLLLQCWQEVVEPQVAEQTRPLYISRKVLWVATSSSVWAQTLALQRYPLLKKLNAQLPEKLTDIRFSSAQWYDRNPASHSGSTEPANGGQPHPSQVACEEPSDPSDKLAREITPELAWQKWVATIQGRSRHLPLCPQCQSPTPEGEIKRWGRCVCCTSRYWADSPHQQPPEKS
jgi:predicted nucleic acid-binding Zn ribbon protein